MAAKKGKIKKIVSLFVILIVILIVAAVIFANQLTKVGVETTVSKAMGTKTSLGKAKLSFVGGSLTLEQLQIANPSGYETQNLLDLTRCFSSVNISSLLTDTITVKAIELDGLTLVVEQKGTTSNLSEILDNIEKSAPAEDEPKTEKEAGKKLLVEKIEITNAKARVRLMPLPGKEAGFVDIKLAPIVMENIGNDSNQAELTVTVLRKVLLALAGAVVEAGGGVLPADMQKALEGSIQGLQDIVGGTAGTLIEGAGKVLGEGGKTVEKTTEDLKKALDLPGNLLKPKEKTTDDAKEK